MTTNNTADDLAVRLKETEEENELLLTQLHLVQEELERNFLENKELEKSGRAVPIQMSPWIDEELPNALAEVQRLQTLVQVLSNVHRLESQNALSSRLGSLLIQSVETPAGLLAAPAKLIKMWRESTQDQPPKELGGKGFEKVIATYANDAFKSVEKLLASTAISPVMQANAYTALARHLKKSDPIQTVEASRRAYALDPRAYRLKWLAFRLHEVGEVLEADAMLDLLPQDTSYSDSEARQVSQVRYEAKNYRAREARQKCGFSERRSAQEKQIKGLTQARDEQIRLANERANQIDALKQAQAQLAQEKTALAGRYDEQAKLAAERAQELEPLKQAKVHLEQERNELKRLSNEQERLLQAAQSQIEAVTQIRKGLEQEKAVLLTQLQEQREENGLLIGQIHQVQEELERYFNQNTELLQEKAALAGQYDEQLRLAAERAGQIDSLTQIQAQLAQEKAALAGQYGEQARLAAERAAQIDSVKQVQAQLAQEKMALTTQRDEQAKLVAERNTQIEALKQQMQARHQAEADLSARQQLMHEEVVRAEAQLDLIKEMVLREASL
jgi:hypothetical protein